MNTLKNERGTVLYANCQYVDASGAAQTKNIKIFNLGIGGLKAKSLLLENGTEAAFQSLISDMAGATITQLILSISYPDGTFAPPTNPLTFGPALEYIWADVLILNHQPNVDPDWRNNPTYLTITATGIQNEF